MEKQALLFLYGIPVNILFDKDPWKKESMVNVIICEMNILRGVHACGWVVEWAGGLAVLSGLY